MALQLGSPTLLIAVWVGAGMLTLLGALTNSEICAMIPETGGQYVFFQKMYGDFFAFTYGWAAFAVFNNASSASIAYVMATYTQYFVALPRLPETLEQGIFLHVPFIGKIFPVADIGVKGLTVIFLGILTWINYRSARSGGRAQVMFTVFKIGALLLLIGGSFFSGKGDFHGMWKTSSTIHPVNGALVMAVIAALSGAFWGYDGWNNLTFISGEIRNPQKNIPRSLGFGLLIIMATYTLIVLSYTYLLPIDKIAGSRFVASDAAAAAFGRSGGALIACLIIVSTLGATNSSVLATPRVTFAMAQANRFFPMAGKIHPRFGTPANALVLHFVWTAGLVFSGSFDMLTDMLVFVSWIFYGMSAAGVFVLRRKMPDAIRPYRVWGYPVVPAIFVVFAAVFLVMTLVNDIQLYQRGQTPLINSVFGLFLTALGIPLYFYFKIRYPASPSEPQGQAT
jgi:APA family basic amino acid/polyamine antiporter